VKGERLAALVVAILVCAGCWELAVALKWVSFGHEPGSGAAGEGIAVAGALVAMLVGLLYSAVKGLRDRPATRVDLALPLAAAALTVARFYSFDPYYAPDLQRFSDGGLVRPAWVYALATASVLVMLLVRLRGPGAVGLTALLLLLCSGTVILQGAGH
jgi:hypothetical protein